MALPQSARFAWAFEPLCLMLKKTNITMRLKTERLNLVPTSEQDLEILFKIFTNEYVRKFLFDDDILGKEQINEFLSTSINTFKLKSYGLWLIENIELNATIGFVGLWDFFEESQPQLLYALLPEYTGQEYASEASEQIIKYSFRKLGYSYLTASCDMPNSASHNVARRMGMKKYKHELINGKPMVFYRIEKSLPAN
jgi:ribosomal-protein-alanine N-acetyltransferase